jgi:hypothetical protein
VLFVFGCLFSYSIAAQTPQWHVQPTICISDNAEEQCSFVMQIALSHLPAGEYCLTVGEQPLGCFKNTDFPLEVSVRLVNNTLLKLVDKHKNTVLSANLIIKTQQATNQRRRLRSPWSIF